jgi:phosphoserine phosphatase
MKVLQIGLLLFLMSLSTWAEGLPSWNYVPARQAIVDFVERVTDESSPDFVPPSERIAVFDNDGTLWAEQPVYFQLLFTLDRLKEMAKEHPQWKTEQPFKAALEADPSHFALDDKEDLMKLLMATHAGGTTDEFAQQVRQWIETARHPSTGKLYSEMVYQPQLELLDYLRANGFKTFIVSGGGIEFMRVWSEEVYGVPPEQVVGSNLAHRLEYRDGKPVLVRRPVLEFVDDEHEKVVGIHKFIGRKPILAVGNSDGDLQMLEWTTSQDGPSLGILVHHTDAEREWAYDRDSKVGTLDKALDEAYRSNWVIVDMANDWATIFPTADGARP